MRTDRDSPKPPPGQLTSLTGVETQVGCRPAISGTRNLKTGGIVSPNTNNTFRGRSVGLQRGVLVAKGKSGLSKSPADGHGRSKGARNVVLRNVIDECVGSYLKWDLRVRPQMWHGKQTFPQ